MVAKLFIVAAERSGDDLGAGLITALKVQNPSLGIMGIGGDAMEDAGVISQMDIEGLSILGFTEGLKHYPMILRKVRECCDAIMRSGAEAVILIDSWGFMIRVAKHLKSLGYSGKIIKYVAPQVWAMRSGRSKILAHYVDLLLSIQSMDAQFFEPHGLETTYVGNPVFDTDYQAGDATHIRNKDELILSVWFGSRPSEISQLSGDFIETLCQIKRQYPNLVVISAVARNVRDSVQAALSEAGMESSFLILEEDKKLDVMAASDVALACSGTVTTQLASAGVPTVVAYRLNALTFAVAKLLFKPSHISIVNIAAGRTLMPEYVQNDVTADNLVKSLSEYLDNTILRENTSKALLSQTKSMGSGGMQKANEKAANAVMAALKI